MFSRRSVCFLLLTAFTGLTACGDSGITADLSNVIVETSVDKLFINAGETFRVACIVIDPEGREVNTDTAFSVSPSKGVGVQGAKVTPEFPGLYSVACMLPDETMPDETPEIVVVSQENIASVETTLSANEVEAGDSVEVTCQVRDIAGEWVEWETEVLVDPVEVMEMDGHTLNTAAAGDFTVACKAVGLPIVDETPEPLTVNAGDPALVVATIKEDEVTAGTTVPVLCTIEDNHGNVLDHTAEIDPQEGIAVEGSDIIPMIVGEYDITCSSAEGLEGLEKAPDHLVVLVGELATLVLQAKPIKDAYKVGDMVAIEAFAADEFGNEVEGIEATITAPEEMPVTEGGKFEFPAEGVYTFTGSLEAPHEDITGELVLYCDETGPVVVVFTPERAVTLDGDKMVSVEGNVVDALSDNVELEVNDVSVPIDEDGNFFHIVEAFHGMNMLTVEAFDAFDNTGKVVQSFYYSSDYVAYDEADFDNVLLEQALLVFLGQNFLDDGDHDKTKIDDVATLIEIVLDSLDLDLLVGDGVPVVDEVIPALIDYSLNLFDFSFSIQGDLLIKLYIDAVSFAEPYVSLVTRDGGLDMIVSFQGTAEDPGVFVQYTVELSFALSVSSFLDSDQLFQTGIEPGISVQSSASIETLLAQVSLDIDKNVGEELTVSIGDLSVSPAGIHIEPLQDLLIDLGTVEFNGQDVFDLPAIPLGDLLQDVDAFLSEFIIDPVVNFITPLALDLLAPIIEGQISNLLGDLLNQFEMEIPLPIPELPGSEGPVEVTFKTKLSFVHFFDSGGELGLKAGFMAPKTVDRDVLGSLLRAGCLSGNFGQPEFDSEEKMAFAAHLDMVNELLFALWRTGGLQLALDETILGDIDLAGFGLTELTVATDFWLPPILNDCTAKGMVEVQVGDLLVTPSFKLMDAPITISMFVSAALDATIFGQGKEVGLEILGITEIGTQILSVDGDLGPLAGMLDIEELIDNVLVPMIIEQVSNLSLGSFPIPEIDLSTLLPGIPEGTTLSLGNLEIMMTKGYLLFGGELL